jgi:hypothetical protein
MENKVLRESYKEHIKNLKEVCIFEYLENGFILDKESILKAIKYFESCMPLEFKEILLKENYWNLYYNSPMVDLFIKTFNITNENHKKAISTFVYTYQGNKRDFEKLEDENSLKENLIKDGFNLVVLSWRENDELKHINKEELEKLNGLKVVCVLDRDKIGLMGSFTKTEQHEGKLIYTNEHLYFLPKRHKKTGQLLTGRFFYKLSEGLK